MATKIPEPKYYLSLLTDRAARKMVAYYNRVLEPMGLTAPQALAVGVLWRKENLSLGEFAARMGIGKAAAVSMIHRLTEQGFVTARTDPADARKNIISLTDKALQIIPAVSERVQHLERTVEQAIGEENLKTVVKALKVLQKLEL